MVAPLLPLLLAACGHHYVDTEDSADTAETGDSADTAETGDSADTGDTGDTAAPPLPARVDVSGAYRDRAFAFGCTGDDPPEVLFRSLSDALGNFAGMVSCGVTEAPHDRFELVLPDAGPGEWSDDSGANQFQYVSDEGNLLYTTEGAVVTAWALSITGFTWQDSRTVQLVGAASGSWTTPDGAPFGWVEASFDVLLECANCP